MCSAGSALFSLVRSRAWCRIADTSTFLCPLHFLGLPSFCRSFHNACCSRHCTNCRIGSTMSLCLPWIRTTGGFVIAKICTCAFASVFKLYCRRTVKLETKWLRTKRDINERGDAVLIEHEVGVFNLVVHHTGEAWNGLLNVHFGAVVRLDDAGKAPSHCGVPAVNAAAVPASAPTGLAHMSPVARLLGRCPKGQGQQRGASEVALHLHPRTFEGSGARHSNLTKSITSEKSSKSKFEKCLSGSVCVCQHLMFRIFSWFLFFWFVFSLSFLFSSFSLLQNNESPTILIFRI